MDKELRTELNIIAKRQETTVTAILTDFITDYVTIQGCCVHYGKLYQGVTVPGAGYNNVIVYDTFKGIALTNVPIVAGWEIQGVAVYNGKVYTTNKSDTALRVYEVEF